jgi:hypothetical protein
VSQFSKAFRGGTKNIRKLFGKDSELSFSDFAKNAALVAGAAYGASALPGLFGGGAAASGAIPGSIAGGGLGTASGIGLGTGGGWGAGLSSLGGAGGAGVAGGLGGIIGKLGGWGNVAQQALGLYGALNPPKLKQTTEKLSPEARQILEYVMALAGMPGIGGAGAGVQGLPTMNLLGPQIMSALQGYSNLGWKAPQTLDVPGMPGLGGQAGYGGSAPMPFDFSSLQLPWATPGINPNAPPINPMVRRRLPFDRNLMERY